MKKIISVLMVSFLLINCGPAVSVASIESVVDSATVKEPYSNTLIIIPYKRFITEKFSKELKKKMETAFRSEQKNVEILAFERSNYSVGLNVEKDIDRKIKNSVLNDGKDLLIILKQTSFQSAGNGTESAIYELVGIDTRTEKEVWKAKLDTRSSRGTATFAEKSAKTIYEKLKSDKMI